MFGCEFVCLSPDEGDDEEEHIGVFWGFFFPQRTLSIWSQHYFQVDLHLIHISGGTTYLWSGPVRVSVCQGFTGNVITREVEVWQFDEAWDVHLSEKGEAPELSRGAVPINWLDVCQKNAHCCFPEPKRWLSNRPTKCQKMPQCLSFRMPKCVQVDWDVLTLKVVIHVMVEIIQCPALIYWASILYRCRPKCVCCTEQLSKVGIECLTRFLFTSSLI